MVRLPVFVSMVICLTISAPTFAVAIIVAKSGGDYNSVQSGLNAASAGDTVYVKAGTYTETVTFSKSGTSGAPIVLCNYGTDTSVIDGNGTNNNIITISGKSYVQVIGIEVRNASGGDPSIGISIDGSGSNILIKNCKVHNIKSDNTNAHGIAVYGTEAAPIHNIVLDKNEVYDCLLGQSESIVLNGNVDTFQIINNVVHDNDNIGIDLIGFESTAVAIDAVDQARNGIVAENHVYNISSKSNPTYSGVQSADGIYVDGGENIIIERNIVDSCDIGIEIASEHEGKTTSNIIIRDNFVSRSYQGNIMTGGYDSNKGSALNIIIVNNTTYHGNNGEILLQYNNDSITVKNNILYANSNVKYVTTNGSNNTHVTVANNLYYGASANLPGKWTDASAIFADPQFVTTGSDFHVSATSPAIDAGANIGTLSGTMDIDGQERTYGSCVDIGADEYGSSFVVAKSRFTYSKSVVSLVRQKSAWVLSFTLVSAMNVSYEIVDVAGKILFRSSAIAYSAGPCRIRINVKKFAKQAFLIRMTLGSDVKAFNVVD